ncbi:MAG: type II methionyl aminopeptidase [Methanobacteriota archaeon]|nr:MAG: type II methionyl aminopeptidase [Euryarchaeota archaeon]
MSEDTLDKLSRAGRVAKLAREFAMENVIAGGSALELVIAIEEVIRSNGAECAFPVNIGVNEVAAHYTPSKENDIEFRTGDVVKIDIGAHIDGYPGDTAATVEVGTRNHSTLIEAAESALEVSMEMVAPGTTVSAMGETIERVIKSSGFKPIHNLTGHSMERFNLHAGLSIPNVKNWDRSSIKEGMVLAIEPFSTTGRGKVEGAHRGGIYRLMRDRKAPPEISTLFSRIQSSFGGFPFAGRWCDDLHPDASSLLSKMVRIGMAMSYPILIEAGKGAVAQAEHSVIVTRTGCRVLTE